MYLSNLLFCEIFGEAKSSIGFELTRDRVFDVAQITAFVFYQNKKNLPSEQSITHQ